MTTFQANRVNAAISALDGSDENDAALDFVLSSVPWHEREIMFAKLENETDALHDAVTVALFKYVGTMH